ncbi:MAG TPA: polysaccharide deacetylase family protein [Oculatellaceae cyanobacterium]
MKNRLPLLIAPLISMLLIPAATSQLVTEAAALSNESNISGTQKVSFGKPVNVALLETVQPPLVPMRTVVPTSITPVVTPSVKPTVVVPGSNNGAKPGIHTGTKNGSKSGQTGSKRKQNAKAKNNAATKSQTDEKKFTVPGTDAKPKPKKKSLIIRTCAMPPDAKPNDQIKYVALTFDDGPNPIYTPKVLAILKKEGVHATFCLIGRHARKYPELVQEIVAEGHKIADHSMNHDEHLDRRSLAKMKAEILGTKELLESIVPGTTVEYYRAPGGNMNNKLRDLVIGWGMKPLGWSVDPKDWQEPGTEQILATVKAQLHSGGVIIMHDAGGDRTETIDALEKVIPELKKKGYQFVFPG